MTISYKVTFCLLPRRLAMRKPPNVGGFSFVGWVWFQKAYLVKNIHYGWIAFAEDQTEELFNRCPACKKLLGHVSISPEQNELMKDLAISLQEAVDGMGGSFAIWEPKARAVLAEFNKYKAS